MRCNNCEKETQPGKFVCACGAVLPTGDGNMCNICNVNRVPVKKKQNVSFIGLLSVIGSLIGIIIFLTAHIVGGALILFISIIAGSLLRPEQIVMTCPSCGNKGRTL